MGIGLCNAMFVLCNCVSLHPRATVDAWGGWVWRCMYMGGRGHGPYVCSRKGETRVMGVLVSVGGAGIQELG